MSSSRSRRGGSSSFGLLIGIAAGAVVIVAVLIGISVLTGGGGDDEFTSFQQYTQEISYDEGVGAVGFAIGEPDAAVTVTDYSDFSCPACAQLSPVIDQLIEEYVSTGDVRIVYKPLTFINPPTSVPAAAAGYCAAQQGYFWEMHDQIWDLFARSGRNAYTNALLTREADVIDGLAIGEFQSCLESPVTQQELQGVVEEAGALGINSTPTVLVNGERLQMSSFSDLITAVEARLP